MNTLNGSRTTTNGLLVVFIILLTFQLALPQNTTSHELSSSTRCDISVPIQDYIVALRAIATSDDEVDWQFMLCPIFPETDLMQVAGALAIVDSLEACYSVIPDSIGCERWTAWQIGICNLELAAGEYATAVEKYLAFFDQGWSCMDHQSMWWHLTGSHSAQLREYHHYSDLAALLQEVEMTFPAGPAREMRSEIARLKYRLGTLEWSDAIRGTLGEARVGGIASHYRDFVTTNGDTLTYLVHKAVVITLEGEVWVPHIGFTPRQDFESEYRGGDPFTPGPLDSGRHAVFYLDSDEDLLIIELKNDTSRE